jgi:hypothetical protein
VSKSRHSEIVRVLSDIEKMSSDDVLIEYGIIINNDGTVIDTLDNYKYSTIKDWIEIYIDDVEQDTDYYKKVDTDNE